MELDIKYETIKSILRVLFVLYIMLLITVVFFKYGYTMSMIFLKQTNRSFIGNFIPFKTIIFYCRTSSIDITIRELLGNVIAFAPMGLLLPLCFDRIKGIVKVSIISFTISLFFEIMQIITNLGIFDVDDMMLNTLGAIIGFMIYKAIINIVVKKS